MPDYGKRIREYLDDVRYANVSGIRKVSLAVFGLNPDKAEQYVVSLVAAGLIKGEPGGWVHTLKLKKEKDEVFPWERR